MSVVYPKALGYLCWVAPLHWYSLIMASQLLIISIRFFLYRNWMTKWQISHFCRNNPENTSPYIFHIHIQIQFLSHKIIWCHKKTILLELCRAAMTKPWQMEHSGFFLPDHNGQTWIYWLVLGPPDHRFWRERHFPTEDDDCPPSTLTRVKDMFS